MNLLLVMLGNANDVAQAFFDRSQDASVDSAETFDHARRSLRTRVYRAVVTRRGIRELAFNAFLRAAATARGAPTVFVLDEELPGVRAIDGSSPGRIADQVLDVLGVARSLVTDFDVRELLAHQYGWRAGRVGHPLLGEVVCAWRDVTTRGVESLRRCAGVVGPGLAPVVEVFWDDPRPHVVYGLPAGGPLSRLVGDDAADRKGPARWLELDVALAVLHGVARATDTLNAEGFPAVISEAGQVWLAETGEVLTIGHGVATVGGEGERWLPGTSPWNDGRSPTTLGDRWRAGRLLAQMLTGRAWWNPDESPPAHLLRRSADLFRRLVTTYNTLEGPLAPMVAPLLEGDARVLVAQAARAARAAQPA